MSQNGQTHFKNLASFAVSNHFGTSCIKRLSFHIFVFSIEAKGIEEGVICYSLLFLTSLSSVCYLSYSVSIRIGYLWC